MKKYDRNREGGNMGARNNNSENFVRGCVQGGEQAIGMVVTAGDDKKSRKEEQEHMWRGQWENWRRLQVLY